MALAGGCCRWCCACPAKRMGAPCTSSARTAACWLPTPAAGATSSCELLEVFLTKRLDAQDVLKQLQARS